MFHAMTEFRPISFPERERERERKSRGMKECLGSVCVCVGGRKKEKRMKRDECETERK